MTTPSRAPDHESDVPAFPEPPGGGVAVAVAGGLAAAGAMFLVFTRPATERIELHTPIPASAAHAPIAAPPLLEG